TLLFFRKDTKTFALHEAMRKGIEFDPEKTKTLVLDLDDVGAEDAERILNAMTNLLILNRYKPTCFGKKAKKDAPKKKIAVELVLRSKLKPSTAKEVFDNALSQADSANLVRTL